MTNIEEEVEELENMINIAYESTPNFLKGLLIPEKSLSDFHFLISVICKDAIRGKEWHKLMLEGENVREKMKLDFIKVLIEQVKDKEMNK